MSKKNRYSVNIRNQEGFDDYVILLNCVSDEMVVKTYPHAFAIIKHSLDGSFELLNIQKILNTQK